MRGGEVNFEGEGESIRFHDYVRSPQDGGRVGWGFKGNFRVGVRGVPIFSRMSPQHLAKIKMGWGKS